MNHESLREVVQSLAECLASHPSDLRLEISEAVKQVTVTINGHRDDIGKLMGKSCRNVQAIEAILNILAERSMKAARVTIAEGWTGQRGDARPVAKELFENAMIRRLGIVCRHLLSDARIEKSGTSTHTTLTVRATDAPPELEPALQILFKAFGGMNNKGVAIEVVATERQAA